MSGSGGFGGGPWGGNPWGGSAKNIQTEIPTENVDVTESLLVSAPYKLISAASISPYIVQANFGSALDPTYVPNYDTSSYFIPGLTILDVTEHPTLDNAVFLFTEEQLNQSYLLQVLDVLGLYGDPISPAFSTALFQGSSVPATFEVRAQSSIKLRVTFAAQMNTGSEFVDPTNYTVTSLKGGTLPVLSVAEVLDGTSRKAELILGAELERGVYYSLEIDPAVSTVDGQGLSPSTSLFQWYTYVPGPLTIPFRHFSERATGGLLGESASQVFFSPAYDSPVANSVLQVEAIDLCTRAYDVYTPPDTSSEVPFLYTYTPPSSPEASSIIGPGTVLWAPAEKVGQARIFLADHREDIIPTVVDGPADAVLQETVDITKAGFLNDIRWETAPAATAPLGVFTTAANLAPIGPGPTTNINLQSAPL